MEVGVGWTIDRKDTGRAFRFAPGRISRGHTGPGELEHLGQSPAAGRGIQPFHPAARPLEEVEELGDLGTRPRRAISPQYRQ